MKSLKKFALGFAVLFTMVLFVGCSSGDELTGRYQDTLDANVVYEFQQGGILAIETAGDSISTGCTYTIDEEAKRLHFVTQAPGGQEITRDASYAYDKDTKTLTITGDDGTQQTMTKID